MYGIMYTYTIHILVCIPISPIIFHTVHYATVSSPKQCMYGQSIVSPSVPKKFPKYTAICIQVRDDTGTNLLTSPILVIVVYRLRASAFSQITNGVP